MLQSIVWQNAFVFPSEQPWRWGGAREIVGSHKLVPALLETVGSSVSRRNWLSGVSGKCLGLLRSLRMIRILLLSTGVRGVREVPDGGIESTGEEVQFTLRRSRAI